MKWLWTRAELLQRLHTSKAQQGALSSSKRLMRVLRPIVEAATDLLAIGVADLLHGRRISAKPVGDERPRSAELLHDALEKLQRCGLIPLRRDHRLQDLAFMVDGAPEMAEHAADLHKHLVQMLSPLRIAAHLRPLLLSDVSGEHLTKPVPPKPDRLIADVDPALGKPLGKPAVAKQLALSVVNCSVARANAAHATRLGWDPGQRHKFGCEGAYY